MRPALLVLVMVASRAALAAGDDAQVAEARKFFDAGKQAYESGRYDLAATAFEEAYRLSPRPQIAFSLAQACRRQYFVDRDPRRLGRAVELYRRYVAEVGEGGRRTDAVQHLSELEPLLLRVETGRRAEPARPPAEGTTQLMVSSQTRGAHAAIDQGSFAEVPLIREVAPGPHVVHVKADGHALREARTVAVEGRLVVAEVNLEPLPARLVVRGTRGAELTIDGRAIGSTPSAVAVPAGTHVVTVAKRGHEPVVRELALGPGQELALEARLHTTVQRRVSWWILGAAGAVLVAGGATTVLALQHQDDAQSILERRDRQGLNLTAADLTTYRDAQTARDDLAIAAAVLWASGAALGLTGLLLHFFDHSRAAMPLVGGRLVPLPVPGGGGAQWRVEY